jgi:hypothetical protein
MTPPQHLPTSRAHVPHRYRPARACRRRPRWRPEREKRELGRRSASDWQSDLALAQLEQAPTRAERALAAAWARLWRPSLRSASQDEKRTDARTMRS